VTVMAAAGPREPAGDLYQLLGVARDASREEIALAWRRRARDEHPDARRGDAGAPERFRALAEAWEVLGDPGRRAAYDRGLAPGPPAGACGPPLAAGPVRVEGGPGPVPRVGALDEEDLRLALLAHLVLRYRRGRPW